MTYLWESHWLMTVKMIDVASVAVVKLRSRSRSGEGQVRVRKVRVRLRSLKLKDLDLSHTIKLVFTHHHPTTNFFLGF